MTERARDLCLGAAVAIGITSFATTGYAGLQMSRIATEQELARQDRVKTQKVTVQLLQALDPEHKTDYEKIMKGAK